MAGAEAAFNRQEQIWAGLYGPGRAQELIELARTRIGDGGDDEVAAVLRSIDADLHGDDDLDEAGTMRPI